jgi:hypothetical protein
VWCFFSSSFLPSVPPSLPSFFSSYFSSQRCCNLLLVSMNSGVFCLALNSVIYKLWPWASYLLAQCLSFLMCNMGKGIIIIMPTSWEY